MDSDRLRVVEDVRVTLGKMQNPVRGFLHGTAAVVSVIGTVFLVIHARTGLSRFAALVFGLGLISLYTTSSLYHAVPWREKWKLRMQRVDHAMILVLIASSYTPVAAIGLDGWLRWVTLAVVWTIALTGISHLLFARRVRFRLSIVLMATLGWMSVFIIWPLARRAGMAAVILIAAGGLLYTLGMVLLVKNRPRLWPRVFSYHEVFHIFVIAASVLHFTATYRYVLPLAF